MFDIQIDLLWFLLPMRLLGGLFHRHFLRRVPWEVEKNLARLTTDWSEAVATAIRELERQALASVRGEASMLTVLLEQAPNKSEMISAAMKDVSAIESSYCAATLANCASQGGHDAITELSTIRDTST
jgi:hypothetical protein